MTIVKPDRVVVVLKCGPCGHEEHFPLKEFRNRRVDCGNCLCGGWMSTMDLEGVVIHQSGSANDERRKL